MQSKNELITNALRAYRPSTVVDIGFAQNPNPHLRGTVYGIDIVNVPTPKNYAETYKIDLNTDRLPFAEKTVDAVTMGCTLAHVANPLKVLAEVNRVLKPAGGLIVSSPNPNYYWESALNIFYHHFKNRVVKAKHYE